MADMNNTIACSSIWFNTTFRHLTATLYLSDSVKDILAPAMKTRRGSSVSKDKLSDRRPRPSAQLGELNVWQWTSRSVQ